MAKTLLLADDSVTIQKVVGISFANEDVTLITVDNGDDAITRAREAHPDVVLADVVMPGKSGYEVCEEIKADPEMRSTPVLLLTGTFEAFDEERARAAGADGHITKPFEAQSLVDQVNELFRNAPTVSPSLSVAVDSDSDSSADDAFDFLCDDTGDEGDAALDVAPAEPIGLDTAAEDDAFSFATPDDARADAPVAAATADHTIAILPDDVADLDITPDDDPLAISHGDAISAMPEVAAIPDDTAPGSDDAAPLAIATPEPDAASDSHLHEDDLLAEDPIEQLEPLAESEPTPAVAPSARTEAATPATRGAEAAAAANLPPEFGERIQETLEKIAWEAFGDLTETLVRQALERVEAVAWEVIPRMAETLIQEEIARLKSDSEDS